MAESWFRTPIVDDSTKEEIENGEGDDVILPDEDISEEDKEARSIQIAGSGLVAIFAEKRTPFFEKHVSSSYFIVF